MKPLIGITCAQETNDEGEVMNRVYHPIVRAVSLVGGLPVLIPTGLDEADLRAIYDRVDGVLLPGGPDIDPVYYGEEAHPTVQIDAARDRIEVPLVRWAVEDDTPLFGICRGHQVINVALGGTLVQDLPSQLEVVGHSKPADALRSQPLHEVEISAGSRLAQIIGATRAQVNSYHHQSVRQPAPPMRVVAYSPDGVVEASEIPDRRFALTVQWHPEDMVDQDDAMLTLFREFVEAARERASRARAHA